MSKTLTLGFRINIPALIAGILLLYIILYGGPWWFLVAEGEEPTFKAEVSPFNINIEILNKTVHIPIIKYITLAGMLTYTLISILLIIGSFFPTKDWSKNLVGIRPLILTLIVPPMIYYGLRAARNFINVNLPFFGRKLVTLIIPYNGINIVVETYVWSQFTLTYYVALIASLLAIIGKMVIKS